MKHIINILLFLLINVILYGLGRYDEALLCFDKALEIDPSNEKAHKGMELILNGTGE